MAKGYLTQRDYVASSAASFLKEAGKVRQRAAYRHDVLDITSRNILSAHEEDCKRASARLQKDAEKAEAQALAHEKASKKYVDAAEKLAEEQERWEATHLTSRDEALAAIARDRSETLRHTA